MFEHWLPTKAWMCRYSWWVKIQVKYLSKKRTVVSTKADPVSVLGNRARTCKRTLGCPLLPRGVSVGSHSNCVSFEESPVCTGDLVSVLPSTPPGVQMGSKLPHMLAFAFLFKHGYHPQSGTQCISL